jgi:hypothetical protein
MKQTIMWLALALLFAIGVTLSITADSFGPAATAETTGPATSVEAPQTVVAASAKPAEPEVPVAMLDDVPPKPTIGSEALARWFVEPGVGDARGRGAGRALATRSSNDRDHCRPTRARLQSGHQAAGRRRSANPKAQRQQPATARQAANGQRQGMRIAKPIFGSIATIESRIALLDQAVSRVRPTGFRDIGGYTNASLPCAVGLR